MDRALDIFLVNISFNYIRFFHSYIAIFFRICYLSLRPRIRLFFFSPVNISFKYTYEDFPFIYKKIRRCGTFASFAICRWSFFFNSARFHQKYIFFISVSIDPSLIEIYNFHKPICSINI